MCGRVHFCFTHKYCNILPTGVHLRGKKHDICLPGLLEFPQRSSGSLCARLAGTSRMALAPCSTSFLPFAPAPSLPGNTHLIIFKTQLRDLLWAAIPIPQPLQLDDITRVPCPSMDAGGGNSQRAGLLCTLPTVGEAVTGTQRDRDESYR